MNNCNPIHLTKRRCPPSRIPPWRIHCHISTFFSFFLLKWKNDFFFFLLPDKSVTEPESDAEQDSSSSSTIDGFEPLNADAAPAPSAPLLMLEPLLEEDREGELEALLANCCCCWR